MIEVSTPIFPATLPDIWTNSGAALFAVLTETDDMAALVFRRYSRVPAGKNQVNWTFLETEYKQFVSFWRDTLLNGHKWFYLRLPSALGMVYCVVRCADKTYVATQSGHRKWDVSMTIDVRERPIGGTDLGPNSGGLPYSFVEDFESGLGLYVHNSGNTSIYTIVPGMSINCLNCDPQNSGFIAKISREVPDAYATSISFNFIIVTQSTDDACELELEIVDAFGTGTLNFVFNPRRELDGTHRAMVGLTSADTDHYILSPTALPAGVEFQFRMQIRPGVGSSYFTITDKSTSLLLQKTIVTDADLSPIHYNRLSFNTDSGGATSPTRYDDIYIS